MKIKAATIARLDLKPGDFLVLRMDGRLTPEMLTRLREDFETLLPGTKVIVLERCQELSILTPSEIAASAA